MTIYIHRARMLDKQVAAIRKAGKKGELAAAQYEKILASLKNHDQRFEKLYNKRTKNGEQRIRNCIKYDLGRGYRLVTVRVGDHLFIPFIGDHDATSHWLERHKQDDFLPDDPSYFCEERVSRQEHQANTPPAEEQQEEVDQYEEQLQAKLDDSLLRAIFQGLYTNQSVPAKTSTPNGTEEDPCKKHPTCED